MDANAKSLTFLGEGKKLVVPFFQRRYVWQEENWDELLNSFENKSNVPFLGSIILKYGAGKAVTESTIIDGQQRLTTITIMAKAIYDCLSIDSKKPGSGIRNYIENFLFYRENAADDFQDSHIKIEHSRVDRKDYNTIIGADMLPNMPSVDLSQISDSSSKILRCYRHYCSIFNKKDDAELKSLFSSIFDERKNVIVKIDLDAEDINEQRIFDTINRAGVRLSSADIIKNNIFKLCLDKCSSEGKKPADVEHIYDTKWEALFYALPGKHNVWDDERDFASVKRTNLEFLLYCVATIKWGKDDEIFSNLEAVYAKMTSSYDYHALELLINYIYEYGIIFKERVLDFQNSIASSDTAPSIKYSDYVDRLLLVLDRFGVQMFYPYVINCLALHGSKYDDEMIEREFAVLESFVVRRRLSGKGVTDYATKCDQILHSAQRIEAILFPSQTTNASVIGNKEIKQYIKKVNNETAKTILFCLELHRRSNPALDVQELTYHVNKYTLEHIMPQKWETYWNNVLVYDDNDILISSSNDERKAVRAENVNSLGNMLLLTDKLNNALKNREFKLKVEGDLKRPGYKTCSTMYITKDILDEYASGNVIWDEKRIHRRANNLYEEIVSIWPDYTPKSVNMNHFSDEAFSDPITMLNEMEAQSVTPLSNSALSTLKPPEEDTSSDNAGNITLKAAFLEMVDKMVMSYSYKPVLLKSFFENSSCNGRNSIDNIYTYFKAFYDDRRRAGLFVEKSDSAFAKDEIDRDAAIATIMKYPFDRFNQHNMMMYTEDTHEISINSLIWNELTQKEKQHILDVCNESLKKYYDKALPV